MKLTPPPRLTASDLAAMEARILRGPPRADVSVVTAYYRQCAVEAQSAKRLSAKRRKPPWVFLLRSGALRFALRRFELRLMEAEARQVQQLGLLEEAT